MLFLLFLLACSSRQSDEEVGHEAVILHLSMMKKAAAIDDRMRAIKSDSSVSQDSIAALTLLMDQWRADVVEVPGAEEAGHHDHAHSHVPLPEITPGQMLDLQTELDLRLSLIGKRLFALKADSIHETQAD